ncbi:unnamed protein product [Adineta steineri]|uniref:Uncharacterized protein n=1 Tax=Adineta steineri TaxID=433720 RepID=A0A819E851_9BILA|nr:unnamed protein product [Adineta steineri]CAF1292027.1 unnamed protein product [Adineta steineri]CAF1455484.1 unnamed protein product [Adineta steineri]CAF3770962.1 unnamed protein product [Adineta steineri]CAF3845855.1 unnamed protein product [Adineta steineri]
MDLVFKKIKTLHGTSTTILSQLSNDNNNCSSYYLLHPYLVLLPRVETTFLPVRIQKFIYSSQEGTYSLDLLTFSMDNKIEEPIFTFEGAVIQQVQGVQSGRWLMEKTIYDKLNITTELRNADHSSYLDTIIKDYCMKRV